MNIKFKKLKLHNFFSFGDAEIDLSVTGYTLVKGINNNPSDSAQSNGSGKSSWGEAILYALTGDTLRGTNSVVNLKGEDGCFVDITFDIDDVHYNVVRYKNYSKIGTNLKLFVNGEDKSGKGIRETEKILNDYLPDLTTTLIGAVIILGQGLPMKFSNNSPSGRKEVLETLSKSDFMIDDIKKRIDSRKATISKELRDEEDAIISIKSKSSTLQDQCDKAQKQLESLADIQELENDISQIQENIEYLKQDKDKELDAEADCTHLIDTLNEQILAVDSKANEVMYNLKNESAERVQPLKEELTSIQVSVRTTSVEINRLKNVKDVCPTCGQRIPGVVKVDTTDLENQLNDLKKQEMDKSVEIDLMQSTYDKMIKECRQKAEDDKKEFIESKKTASAELQEIKDRKSELDKKIDALNYLLTNKLNEKTSHDIMVENLQSTIKYCKDEIELNSIKLVYNESERDRLKSKVDIESKLYSFATREFRGILLLDIIDFIQKTAEKYCEGVFGNNLIEFALDGNNIDIKYDNKYYESLSGGEKQKIDLIVQFSIREMLQKFIGFSSNIIILDEILDNIDSYGCGKVLDMIQQNLSDIESVYIISHHSDSLAIPYDNELVIEKDANGVSRIL